MAQLQIRHQILCDPVTVKAGDHIPHGKGDVIFHQFFCHKPRSVPGPEQYGHVLKGKARLGVLADPPGRSLGLCQRIFIHGYIHGASGAMDRNQFLFKTDPVPGYEL